MHVVDSLINSKKTTYLILELFNKIFRNEVKYKVVVELSSVNGCGLRELARRVGVSHSSLKRHLENLESRGVLTTYYVNPKVKVYALDEHFKNLRSLLASNLANNSNRG
ncbi:MAG: winged helix-turn-helix transcriptional regulator [archaeon GB-1845-036]|nr:winged helix-turn-helix transcriptional regulator [Candidatus Culexmicrobium thermophilum]